MSEVTKNYIKGAWVESLSKKTFTSTNPSNQELLGYAPRSNKKDVENAVAAAREAFLAWSRMPAPRRGELLYKAANNFEVNKHLLKDFIVKETGKTAAEAEAEVKRVIELGRYFAAEATRLHGQTIPSAHEGREIKTVREPIGVFALIIPWNFPMAIPAWKIFPALACGNTVVLKPSELSPVCASKLVEMFDAAGLPQGVLNLVHGYGSEIGICLAELADGVSFTGSVETGKKISSVCASEFKRCSLEMGGKNAVIVLEDADLELAATEVIASGFGFAGQKCTAASNIILQAGIYEDFKKRLLAEVKDFKVCPLISKKAVEQVKNYVNIGRKKDKAKLLYGGEEKDGIFQPTIFADVKPEHTIFKEEIFGPVINLVKANDLEEAVLMANTVRYGLVAAVFTSSIKSAKAASGSLDVGMVKINTGTAGMEIQAPFGGRKQSGNYYKETGGMGGSIDFYSQIKVITIN